LLPDPAPLAPVVAMFGLIVGSFLNVCIYRLPRRESVVFPPSRCARCDRKLQWYENIPVLSWLVLRARCRTCGERISLMYPVVEACTAIVFVLVFVEYGPTPLGVSRLLLSAALIVLFVIDLQHQILPNAITLPGIAVGFAFSLFVPPGPRDSLVGLALGGAVPYAIAEAYFRIRGHEGLGMGDVKMLAMIGAFLGWKLMLVTLLIASFSGSLVGLGFIAAGKGARYALPFGTFLAVGALAATIAGDAFLEWYFSFY
jgi:leader peptidase (prepilin peptidase) / N-methyltransferase